jgi:hypothetical protein
VVIRRIGLLEGAAYTLDCSRASAVLAAGLAAALFLCSNLLDPHLGQYAGMVDRPRI